MDWALITQTLEYLDTLSAEDLAQELSRLNAEDTGLTSAVEQLRGNRENAASFMQTHMPGSQQPDSATLESGSHIGIWQIDCLLGTGGMGEVYRATRADGLFDQQVALKLTRQMGDEFAARFEAERQRLAQLEHPNIARIVDGGTFEDGAPYMTMEFVEGHAIDEHVRRNHLDRSERLGLIERLCAAVAHAHGRLVLHRDIKHDNVLINQDGELRLIDFGVASLIGDGAERGGFSSLTPAYAAPEQLTGKAVSAATDIFAIGMLAHLLETGALPKRQPDGGVMIDSTAIKGVDLSAILAKATATDPAARYGSVDALGGDLTKFSGGFPVAARPVSSLTRFKKMVSRNALASAMGGVAAFALIAGVIGVSVFAVRANEAREEAEQQLIATQFFLEDGEVASDSAGAFKGLFSTLATQEAGLDEAQLRAFLITRSEAISAELAASPEGIGSELLAIGEYLQARGAYAESADVLGKLTESPDISELLRANAQIPQARNLFEIGQIDASLAMFEEVLDWMRAKPFLLETEGYAAVLKNYALYSYDEAAMEESVERMTALSRPDNSGERDANSRAFYLNELSLLHERMGNIDKVVNAQIESYTLSKQSEQGNQFSVSTRSLNLVFTLLYGLQDTARAREYIPDPSIVTDRERGHIRHASYYLWMRSVMEQLDGDPKAGLDTARQAFELMKDDNSGFRSTIAAQLVEAAALVGAAQEAREILPIVQAEATEDLEAKATARAMLAEALVLQAEGKNGQAANILDAVPAVAVSRSVEMTFKYNRLKKLLQGD